MRKQKKEKFKIKSWYEVLFGLGIGMMATAIAIPFNVAIGSGTFGGISLTYLFFGLLIVVSVILIKNKKFKVNFEVNK